MNYLTINLSMPVNVLSLKYLAPLKKPDEFKNFASKRCMVICFVEKLRGDNYKMAQF